MKHMITEKRTVAIITRSQNQVSDEETENGKEKGGMKAQVV